MPILTITKSKVVKYKEKKTCVLHFFLFLVFISSCKIGQKHPRSMDFQRNIYFRVPLLQSKTKKNLNRDTLAGSLEGNS